MDLRTVSGLVRPLTLLPPVVGAGSGAAVAVAATHAATPWGKIALALGSACAATCASNAWNQAFDADIDRMNTTFRPIASGLASAPTALRLAAVLALLALALGALVRPWFLACVGAGVVGRWIYSATPLRTKRLTWGAMLTIAIPRG